MTNENNDNGVGYIGIGAMGKGISANLLTFTQQQGRPFFVSNRTKDKASFLADKGATIVDSPRELATKCSVVMSCLANDAAVQQVFDEYLQGKPKGGSLYIDCSTIYPTTAEELTEKAQSAGVRFLHCPVFGGPGAAADKKLLVVAAGDAEARAEAKPYLEAIGKGVLDVGDRTRSSGALKLIGNFFVSSMIELIAEGTALADKNDIPQSALLEVLNLLYPSPIVERNFDRITTDAFECTADRPGTPVINGIKDLSHIVRLGQSSGVPLATSETMLRHLQGLKEDGKEGLDWSAVALGVRKESK